MRRTCFLAVLLFATCPLLLLPSLAVAQNGFIPVIAKSRSVVDQLDSTSGKTTNHKVEYGTYYQSSNGSYLQQTFLPGSPNKLSRGIIYDTKNDVMYALDYTAKLAVGHYIKTTTRKTHSPNDKVKDGGPSQIINGVECIPYPIWGKEQGQRIKVGTIWQTPDGSVVIRTESTLNVGTSKGTMVSELYDVRLGQEPDPGLFKVPADFKVAQPTEEKLSCPTCPK